MKPKTWIWVVLIFITLFGTIIWFMYPPGAAMVVSVSPNGQYAISSHVNRHIILWDVKNQQKKTLSRLGNIYSAYFINDDAFMWQSLLTKRVIIKNLHNKTMDSFRLPVATYGQVMSQDMAYYFGADQNWTIYTKQEDEITIVKEGFGGFYGGKLLNLALSDDGKYLVSSGESGRSSDNIPLVRGKTRYEAGILTPEQGENSSIIDGLIVWDTTQGAPIHKLVGNQVKTHATLSPDGRYVVSGDEGGGGFVWDVPTGKQLARLHSLSLGKLVITGSNDDDYYWDNTGMIAIPDDFTKPNGILNITAVLALKFIANSDYYLRFTTYVPYAILYHINDPKPLAYLALEGERPSVDAYVRNASIDTAPHANILVTGQSTGHGINVYRYDPTEQTLTLEWVGK